jgi:hypothetical protein
MAASPISGPEPSVDSFSGSGFADKLFSVSAAPIDPFDTIDPGCICRSPCLDASSLRHVRGNGFIPLFLQEIFLKESYFSICSLIPSAKILKPPAASVEGGQKTRLTVQPYQAGFGQESAPKPAASN